MSLNRTLAGLIDTAGDVKAASLDLAASITVVEALDSLPTSNLTAGDQAYVKGTSRFYVSNGAGWYNAALVNATPSLSISPTGTIELNTDGSTTTITLTATDSDYPDAALEFSVESDGNFLGLGTITQDSSVFTITPFSEDSATQTSSVLTFKASDQVNFGSGDRTLSLVFRTVNSKYTSMLLVADSDGTDVQVDASSTGSTLTKSGSIPATAFTPYHPGGYSTYFDGTGDYLSVAYSADHTFGSGAFTVECWVYMTAYEGGGFNTFFYKSDGTNVDWQFDYKDTSTELRFIPYVSGSANTSAGVATATLSLNTWHHVAASRDGSNNLRLFLDGSLLKTSTYSSTIDADGNATLEVGARNNGGTRDRLFSGYIRDVRIVKGSAVYTAAFDVPASSLTAITNTKLLLCHAPYIDDGSADTHTVTVAGDTQVYRFGPYDFKPYKISDHGGSVDYNENTSNFYYANNLTAFGTGDWTVEFWVFFSSVANHATLFDSRPTSTNGAYVTIAHNKDDGAGVYINSAYRIQGSTLKAGQWYHIAVARSGSSTKMFVNGRQFGSTYSDSTNYAGPASRPIIGRNGYSASSALNGFMSDVRSVKGTAIYTSDFTPPSAPLTDVTNTELLTYTNNNSVYEIAHNRGPTITSSGVTVSTAQRKFTTSDSFYFNGSNSYLQVSDCSTVFGTGDWTIEAWVHMTSVTGSRNIYDGRGSATQNIPTIYYNGALYYYTAGGNRITGGTLSADTWYHIAVARSGTSTKMFVDGTQVGSTYSDSINYVRDSLARSAYWGNYAGNLGGDYIGYMQNMRITRGLARYTANFTAPTAGFDG